MKNIKVKILLSLVCSLTMLGCGTEDLEVFWCSNDITSRRQTVPPINYDYSESTVRMLEGFPDAVVSIEKDRLIFPESVCLELSEYQWGDIIVSSSRPDLVRRITGLSRQGQTLVIYTSNADQIEYVSCVQRYPENQN